MEGARQEALVELLRALDEAGYHFTTVTPETHRRVVERRGGEPARDLRDVFGWSLPFTPEAVGSDILRMMEEAGVLEGVGSHSRSGVRVSSLSGRLFLHSAWPTDDEDSVFFGPDTYRFARFIEAEAGRLEPGITIVDMGAGAGPGGILAGQLLESAQVTLIDRNPQALLLAEVNAAAAGQLVTTLCSPTLEGIPPVDLIIANPPFIVDPQGRTYRDGGDQLGTGLSLEWARDGAAHLAPGGRMLLYTGSPIVAGEDALLNRLAEAMDDAGCSLRYEELDPDIFGEELEKTAYRDAEVERIAAVGAVISRD